MIGGLGSFQVLGDREELEMSSREIKFRKRNIFQKYWEIYYEKMIISFKKNKEYRINFWMMNLFDVVTLFSFMAMYYVIGNLMYDTIKWDMIDFFIYFCLNLISWKMLWQHNLRNFSKRLLQGELNQNLLRPVNSYFLSSIEDLSASNFITGIMLLIVVFYIAVFKYVNIFFAVFLMIFSWFYFMAWANFLDSFAFFAKGIEVFKEIPYKLNTAVDRYTPKLFEGVSFFELVIIMPVTIHAFFVVEMFNGRVDVLSEYYILILGSFLMLILGIFLLWYYGLKKYEAYG